MRLSPRTQKYLPILIFLVLAGLIMWDLFQPGYIFAIDMSYGPSSPHDNLLDHIAGNGVNLSGRGISPLTKIIYFSLSYVPGLIMPPWLVQKVPLFLLLALSGVAMYWLTPVKNTYGRYFAGFLYMVNPFVYVRFLSGGFWLLWGYAFLPLAVKSFIDLLKKPNLRSAIYSGLWLTIIAPSQHILIIALGILFLLTIFNLFKSKNRIKLLSAFLVPIALLMLLNVGWLYSIASGEAMELQSLQGITADDLELFAPPQNENVPLNVAAMYGFWREGYDYPKGHLPGWQVFFFLILFLVVYGFITGFKGQNGLYVKAMGLLSIISLILAMGVTITSFLYENIPFFLGFRDSQKFVAPLILAYAYLGSIGVAQLQETIGNLRFQGKKLSMVFAILVFSVVFSYGYTMFFGFHGYLKNTDYPQDYYEVDSLFNRDGDDFTILFLPWHQHMYLSWVEDNVSNPADAFFSRPVIRGDNIELGYVYTESTNPVSRYIEATLQRKGEIENFGEFISPLGIKYVILAKEVDWDKYLFLKEQKDLDIIKDSPHIQVYINRSYSEHTPPIRDKAELLAMEGEIIDRLEENITAYDDRPLFWPIYLICGLLFLGCLGYIIRRMVMERNSDVGGLGVQENIFPVKPRKSK